MSDSGTFHLGEMERTVLRSLCAQRANAATVQLILADLQNYSWRDEENRVVFHALTRLRGRELEHIRESLPAVATRMGFPDVNWDDFFIVIQRFDDPQALAQALLAASGSK